MIESTAQVQQDEAAREEAPLSTADLVQHSDNAAAKHAPEAEASEHRTPLFEEGELSDSRQRWQNIQADFVDDPRNAVRRADELVAALMKRLAEIFAAERSKLEQEWDKGENVSTEDLRQALRRYRSFFDRLLSV